MGELGNSVDVFACYKFVTGNPIYFNFSYHVLQIGRVKEIRLARTENRRRNPKRARHQAEAAIRLALQTCSTKETSVQQIGVT